MPCKCVLQTWGQPLKNDLKKRYNRYVIKENGITKCWKPQKAEKNVEGKNRNKKQKQQVENSNIYGRY